MRTATVLFALALCIVCLAPAAAYPGVDAKAAFETLKDLAGTWEGNVGDASGPPASVEYRVTAAGHTVLETMFAGTEHEMINAYYLDGDQLVVTHYCAAGNQPSMALAATSTPTHLRFDFTGGSNLDPAKDMHIHAGEIMISEGGITEDWHAFQNGEKASTNRFVLKRSAD